MVLILATQPWMSRDIKYTQMSLRRQRRVERRVELERRVCGECLFVNQLWGKVYIRESKYIAHDMSFTVVNTAVFPASDAPTRRMTEPRIVDFLRTRYMITTRGFSYTTFTSKTMGCGKHLPATRRMATDNDAISSVCVENLGKASRFVFAEGIDKNGTAMLS